MSCPHIFVTIFILSLILYTVFPKPLQSHILGIKKLEPLPELNYPSSSSVSHDFSNILFSTTSTNTFPPPYNSKRIGLTVFAPSNKLPRYRPLVSSSSPSPQSMTHHADAIFARSSSLYLSSNVFSVFIKFLQFSS